MTRKIIQVTLALFLLLSNAFAQGDFDQKFAAAAMYVDEGRYNLALPLWQELYNLQSDNANINYNLGLCILKVSADKSKAIPYLEVATTNTTANYLDMEPEFKKAPHKSMYYLAQAYHQALRFDDALKMFELYKGKAKKTETALIEREMGWAKYASEMMKHPVKSEITNLGDSINTKFPEYGALITADESMMIFTGRREGTTGGSVSPDDGYYFEDIYISYKNDDNKWTAAKSIGTNINTNGPDAAVALSPDGQQLILYKGDNGGDLYISTLEGDVWSYPTSLGANINTKYWEPSACFSADGNMIIFVSDRPGGLGGRDLYRVVKLPNGEWSLAQNLGPVINTAFDEDAPFLHPDGKTLYYSSNGHRTLGGFDILYSSLEEENSTWTAPNNMGYPVNTVDDDVFFVTSLDGKRSYYSSGKPGGKGEKDIYMITLPDVVVEQVVLLKGTMNFDGTLNVPGDVRIRVTDLESGETAGDFRPNSKTGKYNILLEPGKKGRKFEFVYTAAGYLTVADTIELTSEMSYQNINNEVRLKLVNMVSKASGTVALKGTVTDPDGRSVKNLKITVKDNSNGELVSTLTPAQDNSYYLVVQKGKNYNISFEAEGYLFRSENVNVSMDPSFSDITRNIVMEPIKVGAKVVLNNIFFDSGKSNLRKESMTELEKLHKLLTDQPNIKIEISGHTDNKGNPATNLKLSQQRAAAVTAHLVKKGIAKSRLVTKGYGHTQPIASNTLPNGKPDPAGMQMNRRVEFKILSTDENQGK